MPVSLNDKRALRRGVNMKKELMKELLAATHDGLGLLNDAVVKMRQLGVDARFSVIDYEAGKKQYQKLEIKFVPGEV